MKLLDGKLYGRLRVERTFYRKIEGQEDERKFCSCKCACGNKIEVLANNLVTGRTTSCGCKKLKLPSLNGVPITSRNFQSEYNAWRHLIRRCYDEADPNYRLYGERGISVCGEWLESFPAFLIDMGKKPGEDYQIDRINNDGNYEPGNCRWVTPKEQALNRRNTKFVSWEGEKLTLEEIAIKLGLTISTVKSRFYAGKPLDEILAPTSTRNSPINPNTYELAHNGKSMSIVEWAAETGIQAPIIMRRLRDEWSAERILTTPSTERREPGSLKNKVIEHLRMKKTLGEWAEFLNKDYNTIKGRYLNGLPLDKVLSFDTHSPGRNDLRGISSSHLGQTYGELEIVGISNRNVKGHNRKYAVCRCSCGNEKEILLTNVTSGKVKSCGCLSHRPSSAPTLKSSKQKYSIKGIEGKRFGRLVVQEVEKSRTPGGGYKYTLKCLCDCGNTTHILVSAIGRVFSCGCYNKDALKSRHSKKQLFRVGV